MLQYLDLVIKPYLDTTRAKLEKPDATALIICDVFAAHRTESVKEKIRVMNAEVIYVPAGCTGNYMTLF